MLEEQLGGKERKKWLEPFSLLKGKRFIPAPGNKGKDAAIIHLVDNPPDEMSKVFATWPELEQKREAITTELCTCDDKTFYEFFKRVENYSFVTRLHGKKAQMARAIGIWPPEKLEK